MHFGATGILCYTIRACGSGGSGGGGSTLRTGHRAHAVLEDAVREAAAECVQGRCRP